VGAWWGGFRFHTWGKNAVFLIDEPMKNE